MNILSKKQKAVICQLAARAYNTVGASLGFDSIASFRHASVFDAAGKSGLTACDQLDYIPVYNYLAGMIGLAKKEDNTPKSAHERALWVLRDSMQRWEISESYAATIIMARLGLVALTQPTLAELATRCSAEDLRQVNYTIINRGRSRMRKVTAAHNLPPVKEVHTSPATMPPGRLAGHLGSEFATSAPAPRKQPSKQTTATAQPTAHC